MKEIEVVMSSYLEEKRDKERNEAILKMNLEKIPEYYRDIFKNFLKSHNFYYWSRLKKEDEFLNLLIFQKYNIQSCNVYINADKYYSDIQKYKRFFYIIYQFEVSENNQSYLSKNRVYFKENSYYNYSFKKTNVFDFNVEAFYINCILNKFTKKVDIVIYDNLDRYKFMDWLDFLYNWKI